MSESKDKKIIDRYIKKHPNATPKKIEEYAKSKGIHISVIQSSEHERMRKEMIKDLGIKENLDLQKPEDQKKLMDAIQSLPKEKRDEYLRQVK